MWVKVHALMPSLVKDQRISFKISESGVSVMFVQLCSLADHMFAGASSMSFVAISCQIDQSCGVGVCHGCSCPSGSVWLWPLTVSTKLMLSLIISHFQFGSSPQ